MRNAHNVSLRPQNAFQYFCDDNNTKTSVTGKLRGILQRFLGKKEVNNPSLYTILHHTGSTSAWTTTVDFLLTGTKATGALKQPAKSCVSEVLKMKSLLTVI